VKYLKSANFSKALLVGIAVSAPIITGIALGYIGVGVAIGFGAFWSSPSNTPGSYHHKKLGILFSTALVTVVSFIGGYLTMQLWLLIPILGAVTFAIAFLSVYGFRASLISFSGLLALVLSFAHTPATLAPYQYSLLVGAGGLWYLALVMLSHRINPKAQTEESLAETFEGTAAFLRIRARLMGEQPNRHTLERELHELQTDLIEHHETLRDILIASRKGSGNSKHQNKQLLIFVQLVELLETAIANPVDYAKMDALFIKHPKLKEDFQKLIFSIADQLNKFANSDAKNQEKGFPQITSLFKTLTEKIKEVDTDSDYEEYVILQNLLDYQEKQFERLKRIQWLTSNPKLKSTDILTTKALQRFLVPQEYDLKMGLRNLTFKSAIFKHSLRLAVTMMVGYLIGSLFQFQNPYWILLTIIVIMRPSYGLTKTRSKDRIIGTLIGAVIATGFVVFITDVYVLGAMGMVALIIAFSVVQKNYKVAAAFITLSVVFIYAIIRPDVLVVVQYRILDTLIGAGLSFMAILWLWPAWGFHEIRENIRTSVAACQDFLERITTVYIEKKEVSTGYKVARKKAFLETSNLNAAFQRMAQEPKSKQLHIDTIYELVVLNHTLLSSLASLSTYLQHHKTTPASTQFKEAVKTIQRNIAWALQTLSKPTSVVEAEGSDEEGELTKSLLKDFSMADMEALLSAAPNDDRNYQEAHLIWEQLRWQYTLSKKMVHLTKQLQ